MKTANKNKTFLPRTKKDQKNTRIVSRSMIWGVFLFFILSTVSCNNNQLSQQNKELHDQDSVLMVQTKQDDSAIKGYIHSMNEIQDNLDQIKSREKIISVKGEGATNTVADIQAIDELILKNHKELNGLQARLKKMSNHDKEMEAMIARLTTQVSQQDSQILVLQTSLANTNDSYKKLNDQFNDSLVIIQNQNSKISTITGEMNTVYYAIGTIKELKENKVIDKSGGFAGIGRNTSVKPDFNSSYFTRADLTKLQVIPLNGKFKKLISTHPTDSYKISGNKTADSLWITNQEAFWKANRYLVIAVK